MAATGTPTPNIGLRIPLGTDPASVDDINYNSNLIDTKLGAVGNDSIQDQIDDLNSNINAIPKIIAGIANYTGLKGGGWADRVSVPISFSSNMPNVAYDVFATVGGAYADFHFITCTPDASKNTVSGTEIILVNHSGSTTAATGNIYWVAIQRNN